jgi:hypothetical protein
MLSIQHDVVKAAVASSHALTDAAVAESASPYNHSEIDKLPVITKNCAKENPAGAKKAESMYATTENIDAAVFCLQPGSPVDPALKDQVCGTPTRKKVFGSARVTVNEVTFAYRPVNQKSAPIQIVIPEIEADGKKFISVDDPDNDSQNLKESFALNDSQMLFKARDTGPWMVYLMSAKDKDFSLQKLGWFAYPGGPFADIGNGNFLYDTQSSVLVRKTPFGYLDRVLGLVDMQDQKAVAIFEQDDTVHARVVQFTADPSMQEKPVSSLDVPVSCFGKDGLLPERANTAERQQWFNKYFVWSSNKSAVSLKATCRKM